MEFEVLYRDCDYLNKMRDSSYAPFDGNCKNCYRYAICKVAKENEP